MLSKFSFFLKFGLLSLLAAFIILACRSSRATGEKRKKPDPNFHIYVLAGQSNMAGRGKITDTFANMSHERVYKLNQAGEWVLAKHPLHSDKPKMVGVGPGLSFGIEMAKAKPSVRIGLIPCAVGGSPIETWEPGGYHTSTKKYPYDEALARIREAMKYGVVKGVIWHQGEANSNPGREKDYLKKLSVLIERFRKEVKDSNLPFVAGELGRYRERYSVINEQLKLLPETVKNTRVVSSEGLVHKGDGTHFDSPSADEFGKRFAAAMLALENKQ
jgi:Domain of unknown function (DUF303).